jgi:endonuclease/exonuclease/phosphatase (EEP) superfamily protein YafD
MDTALRMQAETGPAIVAGDFNATPWTPVVRRLARLGLVNDPRVGRGWLPTWKADSALPSSNRRHAACSALIA